MQVRALKILTVAMAISAASATLAQSYPVKPVRVVLGVSGGGETVARIYAQEMSAGLGQPVIVDPQSAAGGSVGASMVARAAPDGYTLLYASPNSQVFRLFLVKDVGYDPIKDFTSIAKNVTTPLAIAASSAFPVSSLQEFIDYARRNPGKVSYSTTGIGTGHHLNSEHLKSLTGIDFVHVPYKSGPQQVQDLIGGRVQMAGSILSNLLPLAKSGKVRLLAIIGRERNPLAPEVPTVREIVPGFESLEGWSAYFGPAGLPRPVVQRIHAEISRAGALPTVRTSLEQAGYGVDISTPEELDALLRSNIMLGAKLAARAGVRPE